MKRKLYLASITGFQMIPNYIHGAFAAPAQIQIDFSKEVAAEILLLRDEALGQGFISNTIKKQKFPVTIKFHDSTYAATMKLTGSNPDHLEDRKKWSFEFNLKGDQTILGMKKFALLNGSGRSKNLISEWICHKLGQAENLLSLRYQFVEIILNGSRNGIYAMEEKFDSRLIEHNKLRNGVIFQIDGDKIDFSNQKQITREAQLSEQVLLLRRLWKSFMLEEITTSQLFDIDKLAKHFAIADLVDGHHVHFRCNSFYYFNPVTRLCEPIGREWGSPYSQNKSNHQYELYLENPAFSPVYARKLFSDVRFVEQYVHELDRMSKKDYLDSFLATISTELEEVKNILYKDYSFRPFDLTYLHDNQSHMRSSLKIQKHLYYLKANVLHHDVVYLYVEIRNLQKMPLEIVGLSYRDSVFFSPVTPVLIFNERVPQHGKYRFNIPDGIKITPQIIDQLKINFKIPGKPKVADEVLTLSKSPSLTNIKFPKQVCIADLQAFEFIESDSLTKTITLKPGKWKLSKDLVIPEGFQFFCHGNSTIDLIKGAKIISYSPLLFYGTNEQPILITSSDSSGQGLVVFSAGRKSILAYTTFTGLTNVHELGWNLTGAVTFYDSPVDIRYCQFHKNHAEDALNIMRTTFSIEHARFSQTTSDAFDADFCEGTISKSSFDHCGNDAIDISGSTLTLNDITVSYCGDKGINAGEQSTMKGARILIENVEIAVTSKDLSVVELTDCTLRNSKVGFCAFQKKQEFGSGRIRIRQFTEENVERVHLIEEKSSLQLNGQEIDQKETNVKDMLYGNLYGKKSN